MDEWCALRNGRVECQLFGMDPLLGLKPAATKLSSQENAMMIFSHLVWGIVLAATERELRRYGNQMLDSGT